VPNTGPYDPTVNVSAVAALFDRIGPAILVTHSQSGTLGWRTATRSPNVRAVVSFEPGGDFLFPEGESPSVSFGGRSFTPPTLPLAEFQHLTRLPIIVYYGDNIPEQPSTNPGQEQWRVFREVARRWRDAVNRHGGDVTLVDLPAVGIRGNTHFPMSDLNNVEVATHLADWLQQKGLDR
jgi:pimeloyl-ACP methyl ester carboxylesterase